MFVYLLSRYFHPFTMTASGNGSVGTRARLTGQGNSLENRGLPLQHNEVESDIEGSLPSCESSARRLHSGSHQRIGSRWVPYLFSRTRLNEIVQLLVVIVLVSHLRSSTPPSKGRRVETRPPKSKGTCTPVQATRMTR
jgi:hypothetical protein